MYFSLVLFPTLLVASEVRREDTARPHHNEDVRDPGSFRLCGAWHASANSADIPNALHECDIVLKGQLFAVESLYRHLLDPKGMVPYIELLVVPIHEASHLLAC